MNSVRNLRHFGSKISNRKKKFNIISDNLIMQQKIKEHFSKFNVIKLDLFGDDKENYGNMQIRGIIYPPKKINLVYVKEKVKRGNKLVYNKSIFDFEKDNVKQEKNRANNKKNLSKDNKLKMPLISSSINKNNSLDNSCKNKGDTIKKLNNYFNKTNQKQKIK